MSALPPIPSVLDEPEVVAKRSPLLEALNALDARQAHEAGIAAVATVLEYADDAPACRDCGWTDFDFASSDLGPICARCGMVQNPPPASGSTQEDESMASTNATPGFVGSAAGSGGHAGGVTASGGGWGAGRTTASGIPQGRLVGAERADVQSARKAVAEPTLPNLRAEVERLAAMADRLNSRLVIAVGSMTGETMAMMGDAPDKPPQALLDGIAEGHRQIRVQLLALEQTIRAVERVAGHKD